MAIILSYTTGNLHQDDIMRYVLNQSINMLSLFLTLAMPEAEDRHQWSGFTRLPEWGHT